MRKFEDQEAKRENVPVLASLVGPSSSGKTKSALRIATGMQQVTGGEIGLIDTESRRALHYAEEFKFRHLGMKAPFSPLDYLAAVKHFVEKGVKTLIIDSMSHEHDGPGGVLEWHKQQVDELSKRWNTSPSAVQMTAWAEPKAARKRFINEVLQLGINGVFCFKAKEKIAIVKKDNKNEPIQMGWEPIAGTEWMFEWTFQALLLPNSGGVPTWDPDRPGEQAMVKLPDYLAYIFEQKKPLDEEVGVQLASWGQGKGEEPDLPEGADGPSGEVLAEVVETMIACQTLDELNKVGRKNAKLAWSKDQREQLNETFKLRQQQITGSE